MSTSVFDQEFEHRGKMLEFWRVSGEVIDSQKNSETHVSSTRGYTDLQGRMIKAPSVHSRVDTKHDIWIKTDDGKEKPITLNRGNIPLRAGQKITVISTGVKKPDSNGGYYSTLINHSAEKHWTINSASSLNKLLRIDLFRGTAILVAAFIFFLTIWITGLESKKYCNKGTFDCLYFSLENSNPGLIFGLPLLYLIVRFISKNNRINRFIKNLDIHLEKLAQDTYHSRK